jgi:hypothetical protein
MATLQDLMGAGIPAGLLDPQQEQALQERAKSQGLLNLGFALLQASQGQPGQGKPRLGQIIAQAGPAFGQAYQGAFDETLQNIVRGQQIQEMQRKRKAEIQRQTAIEKLRPTLSEQDQLLFEAAPSEFIGKRIESQFREQPESFRQLTTEEVTARGLPANKTYQVSSKTGKVSELGGGGVSVTVPVSLSTEKKYGEAFATQVAQEDVKLRDAALSAPDSLRTIETTKKLLDEGKVFTGAFANKRLAIAAAGKSLGLTGKTTDELIANTEQLFASRAKATLDNVKNSGLGAGQGFTDKDREFLEKAVLGNIEFSIDSLKRQIEIEEKVANGTIRKWNNRYKELPQDVIKATGVQPVQANRNIEVDY